MNNDTEGSPTPGTPSSTSAPPLVFRASGSLLPFVLIVPLVAFVIMKALFPVPVSPTGEGQVLAWAGTGFSYVSFEWIAIVTSILFFGALGATTSAFTRPGTEVRARPVNLIAVQALGAIFAGMLALMFMGGLVQGSLFPQFSNVGWSTLQFDASSWARLLVWSFLAGFSERLVPDLLDRLIYQSREDRHAEDAVPATESADVAHRGGTEPPAS